MDSAVIREKFVSIRQRLDRIKEDLPDTYEDLAGDAKTEDAILWNFCQAVQQCVNVATHVISTRGWPMPRYTRSLFDLLHEKGVLSEVTSTSIKGAVTIRNIATHRYVELDMRHVHDACANTLHIFRDYVEEIRRVPGCGG